MENPDIFTTDTQEHTKWILLTSFKTKVEKQTAILTKAHVLLRMKTVQVIFGKGIASISKMVRYFSILIIIFMCFGIVLNAKAKMAPKQSRIHGIQLKYTLICAHHRL